MNDAEGKSARDIVKDLQDLVKKVKVPKIGPFVLAVPDAYAKYAANLYANQNVIVQSSNGSIYQCGVQIKQPENHIDVTRLNEKIAAMELPTYVKRLQVLTSEERKVYLLGEWITAEEGDNHGTS